ncbi:MAG: phosphotransferase enzyme family protein, partial [Candidatus Thorarchaeota archaeon]
MTSQNLIPDSHLQKIGDKYGTQMENLHHLGGFENSVYSFSKNGKEYVLRIGNAKHMTFNLVQAEIDWVLHLVENDVPAIIPVPSKNGSYVESISVDDVSYNVVAFEKAEGAHLDHTEPQKWDKQIITDWGRVIGQMHAATKKFKHKSSRRYEYRPAGDSYLYKNESKAIQGYITNLFQDIDSLPRTTDSYGIVHSDIHTGNFFVKDKKISAIMDFDRACYKWFVSEFAISLYYPLYLTKLRSDSQAQTEFIQNFFPLFLKGYETENKLDSKYFENLDLFIRARDVILLMYAPSEDWRKH